MVSFLINNQVLYNAVQANVPAAYHYHGCGKVFNFNTYASFYHLKICLCVTLVTKCMMKSFCMGNECFS